jgi:hypothetical protein
MRTIPLLALLLLALAAPAAAAKPAPAAPAAPAVVALELPPGAAAAPAWVAPAAAAPLPPQRLPGGAMAAALPGFAAAEPAAAPVTLLRQGRLRGRHFAVYAVAPGGPAPAALAAAIAPGARPVGAEELARLDAAPFATGATPPDPAAAGRAWTVTVEAAGIQSLDAAALAAAGLPAGSFDPAALRLRHRGREIALEEVRGPGGALEALRFFANPGDRWSASSVYWLTVGAGPGLRVAARDAAPAGAPASDTALERGAWRTNAVLETRLPGPDVDRFFSADLRTAPQAGGGRPAVLTATLAPRLPAAPGEAALTVAGDSLFDGPHALRVRVGDAERDYGWPGAGPWSARLSFPAGAPDAQVALLPAAGLDGVHLDGVAWELPVRLELGGKGAAFSGRPGRWAYRLAGLPPGARLYDVTDPERPALLRFPADSFEDEGARDYVVAGPGTLHGPALAAHAPVDLARPLDAEAIYVAPAAFMPALEPLLQHRRAQGLHVAAVSTEAIYAGWSYGQLDPEAIRSFLRYAAQSWPAAPATVVLVGDGSSDPRNYLGRNNLTWVPPYLAEADPWIGETACDSCYVRLDGADPLADIAPDMAFGRIPAKSADELRALVAKILAYEGGAAPGAWRATVALVADNPDDGGDFARASEAVAALQPPAARINRVYYDPAARPDDPWRVADPLVALGRSMGAFDSGAAIVQYTGHGLQFQWGYTGPPLRPGEPTDKQFLLGLFGVDELRNGPRLPVVLSMTCLTGSFQIPAFSGTSIDERLVARADGGAIAAWTSTGLGVLYGHAALQRGFYRALWSAPGARLGQLTFAGLTELVTAERCCQDSVGTYVLLGDPLTAPRVDLTAQVTSLPVVRR